MNTGIFGTVTKSQSFICTVGRAPEKLPLPRRDSILTSESFGMTQNGKHMKMGGAEKSYVP